MVPEDRKWSYSTACRRSRNAAGGGTQTMWGGVALLIFLLSYVEAVSAGGAASLWQ